MVCIGLLHYDRLLTQLYCDMLQRQYGIRYIVPDNVGPRVLAGCSHDAGGDPSQQISATTSSPLASYCMRSVVAYLSRDQFGRSAEGLAHVQLSRS